MISNNEVVVYEVPKDLPTTVATTEMIPNGLEECFSELVKFELSSRIKRDQLIQKVAEKLFTAGIPAISPFTALYDKLFLWYIKYGKFDVSMMKIEENQSKYKSIYDLELAFPELTCSSSKSYRKPIKLQDSRSNNRSKAENEIVKIHTRNKKCYWNMIQSINKALARKSKPQDAIMLMDDTSADEEDIAEHSRQRNFLYQLITGYECLKKEYEEEIDCHLEKGGKLTDKVINLYLERILQPMADSTNQNILFISTDLYKKLESSSATANKILESMSKYDIVQISKFVFVCNAPHHWYTIFIEYDWTSDPTITFMDSMSTQEPSGDDDITIIAKLMELFSTLFRVELASWQKVVPLKTILQPNDVVTCGIWALLFAESCLEGFTPLETLGSVDINHERQRIREQLATLLDWNTYHKSYTCQGIIYKERNPESEAFVAIRKKLKGTKHHKIAELSGLTTGMHSLAISKKRKFGDSSSAFKYGRANEERVILSRAAKPNPSPEKAQTTSAPMKKQRADSTESLDLSDGLVDELADDEGEWRGSKLPASNKKDDMSIKDAKESMFDETEWVPPTTVTNTIASSTIELPPYAVSKKENLTPVKKMVPSEEDKELPKQKRTEPESESYDLEEMTIRGTRQLPSAVREHIEHIEKLNKDYEIAEKNLEYVFRRRFNELPKNCPPKQMQILFWDLIEFSEYVVKHIDDVLKAYINKYKKIIPINMRHVSDRYDSLRPKFWDTYGEIRKCIKDSGPKFNLIDRPSAIPRQNYKDIFRGDMDTGPIAVAPRKITYAEETVEDDVVSSSAVVVFEPTEEAVWEDNTSTNVGTLSSEAVESAVKTVSSVVMDASDAAVDALSDAADEASSDDASMDTSETGLETASAAVEASLEDIKASSQVATSSFVSASVDASVKSQSLIDQYFNIEKVLVENVRSKELAKRVMSPGDYAPQVNAVTSIKLIGLPNLHNSCYFNAVIQVLFRIKSMKEVFAIQPGDQPDATPTTCFGLIRNLYKIFETADLSDRFLESSLVYALHNALEYVRVVMKFKKNRHHDAGEFLIQLLSQLHLDTRMPYTEKNLVPFQNYEQSMIDLTLSIAKADWNNTMNVERVSPIMENFYFQLKCLYKCRIPQCGGSEYLFEYRHHLLISLTPTVMDGFDSKNPKNILQLIKASFDPEEVQYRCTKCGKLQNGTVEKEFIRTPKNLIIAIDRRSAHDEPAARRTRGGKTKGNKATTPAAITPTARNYPIRVVIPLDISSLTFVGCRNTNKMVYKTLVGIVMYNRFTSESGHYIAIVEDQKDSYKVIDDDKILQDGRQCSKKKTPILNTKFLLDGTNFNFNYASAIYGYE